MDLISLDDLRKSSGFDVDLRSKKFPKRFKKCQKVDGGLKLDSNNFLPSGLSDMLSYLGIPPAFFRRVDNDDLLLSLVNHMSQKYSADSDLTLVTSAKEGATTVHGVKRSEAQLISPSVLLDSVQEKYPEVMAERYSGSLSDMHINFAFPASDDSTYEVTKDDILTMGASVHFSPVMNFYPDVSPLVFRLVCSNGLIAAERFDRGNKGYLEVGEGWDGAVMRMLSTSLDKFEGVCAKLSSMREHKIDDVSSAVLSIGTLMGLTKHHTLDLIDTSIQQDVDNMYDLVNVITQYANGPDLSFANAIYLQSVAGTVIEDQYHMCGECGSVHRVK